MNVDISDIFKEPRPKDWKDLQDKVCTFLIEVGYTAISPYIIKYENNEFEIDVYAEINAKGINQKILIECKNWNTNIPQDVIFSMITRVNSCGANTGIIISKKGFQIGAKNACKNKNILLYTYDEFIEHFIKEWIDTRLNEVYNKLSFLNSVEFDCILEYEEEKGENSKFIQEYGYLFLIYNNMIRGRCVNYESYDKTEFLNFIPLNVKFFDDRVYQVNVLGDAFRLFLETDYLNQLENIEKNTYLKLFNK